MPWGKKKKDKTYMEAVGELEQKRRLAADELLLEQNRRRDERLLEQNRRRKVLESLVDNSIVMRTRKRERKRERERNKEIEFPKIPRLYEIFGSSPALSSEAPLGVLSTSSPMRPPSPRIDGIIDDYIFKDDSPVAEGDKILPRIPSPYRHMKQVPLMIARQQKRKTRARMKKKKHQKQTKKKKKKKNTKKKKK
jgi:hypothetical protein